MSVQVEDAFVKPLSSKALTAWTAVLKKKGITDWREHIAHWVTPKPKPAPLDSRKMK